MNVPSPGQRPSRERLDRALREQGADAAEIAEWLPVVERLADWPARKPGPQDAQRLLAVLAPMLPAPSPVREAIRQQMRHQGASLAWLLALARAQVSLFGAGFWLVSALVTVIGGGVVLANAPISPVLLLNAVGPLLAYLGTVVAFRGTAARVVELELVCLPSPVQLALARLILVLGYDVCLSLAFALLLWAGGASQVLTLVLAWFMPLLLVAGIALVLSLRLTVQVAASVAYASWLAVVAINALTALDVPRRAHGMLAPTMVLPLTPLSEAVLGGIGVVLLAIAVLRLRPDMHHVLPQV